MTIDLCSRLVPNVSPRKTKYFRCVESLFYKNKYPITIDTSSLYKYKSCIRISQIKVDPTYRPNMLLGKIVHPVSSRYVFSRKLYRNTNTETQTTIYITIMWLRGVWFDFVAWCKVLR